MNSIFSLNSIMKFDSKTLLKDKNVLRFVSLIAIINLISYVMIFDYDSVAFFAIIGFLTTYFSKNVIVVLIVAMTATNLLAIIRRKNIKSSEGFGGKGSERKGKVAVQDPSIDFKPATSSEDEEIATGVAGKLDQGATIESAYENLENMLDSKAISKMSGKTKELAKRQQNLHKQIQTLQPAMKQSFELLNKMGGADGINGMIKNVENIISSFGGLGGKR